MTNGRRIPRSSVDRFLKRLQNNSLVALALAFGATVIAFATFTDAILKLEKFFGWRTEQSDTASLAKEKIQGSVRDIESASPAEARRRLTILEGYVAELNTPAVKQAALKELVNTIFENTNVSTRLREIRKLVVAAIVRINGKDFSELFGQNQFDGVDLYGVDFSNTNLRNVTFKESFLVESSFEGAILDEVDFSGAFIRNANFTNASVVGTTFKSADWFNARGFTVQHLRQSKTKTLLPCPKNEEGMQDYLAHNYEYDFKNWGSEIQADLRANWKTYWEGDGLAAVVDQWNSD